MTKIGDDGRAIKERHFSYHKNSSKHSYPHDHIINWNSERKNPLPQRPINYSDGAPEFKHYLMVEKNMSKITTITKKNTFEDDRFKTISKFKDCIIRGGKVEFEWKGN